MEVGKGEVHDQKTALLPTLATPLLDHTELSRRRRAADTLAPHEFVGRRLGTVVKFNGHSRKVSSLQAILHPRTETIPQL